MFFIGDQTLLRGSRKVTYILLSLMVLSFLATYRVTGGPGNAFSLGGVIPQQWFAPENFPQHVPAWLSLIWALFLHANFGHIFWNALFFWFTARNLEARMGSLGFFFFYLACGAAGFATHVLFNTESSAPVIGASGAISGMLGAYGVWFHNHMFQLKFRFLGKSHDFRAPILALVILWIASQVLVGIPEMIAKLSPVAVLAHLGGFVCGSLIAYAQKQKPSSRHRFKTVQGGRSWND
ncbi:MAG: rhomboid family intramembrane serine protease [Acidobacteria bacterium]|nr:rhomboid family intramembrane serine protease [Acidobacteriota bacterium]MCB9399228.1 rhomboid family intramembrane serine protease [Acidobacteriota bacterium]